MGGGGSKALEKKRAKEFAASDDDDDDDPERTDMHISRSLYKILNGNLATVKLPKPSESLCSTIVLGREPRLDMECHPGRPGATHLSKNTRDGEDDCGSFFPHVCRQVDGQAMIQTDACSHPHGIQPLQVEKGLSIRENRCKWCHDAHDEALSLHCLCRSHRISEQRLSKAILLRSHPSPSETILDHTYKHAHGGNPIGTVAFMAIGEQEFFVKKDQQEAEQLLHNQKKLARHTAMKLLKRLNMMAVQKAVTAWCNNAKWQRAIINVFEKFDKDKSGKLDLAEIVAAINSLGANLTVSKAGGLVRELSEGGSELNVDQFEDMLYLMDDDERPDLKKMVTKMKAHIDLHVEMGDRRMEMHRLRHNNKADDKKSLIDPKKIQPKVLKMVNKKRYQYPPTHLPSPPMYIYV